MAFSSMRIQPGTDIVTGIEWFTVAGASAPAGSSLQVDDMSTAPTDPVPGARPTEHPDVARAADYLRSTLRKVDGFVGAALLAGHRGELVVYSQWRKGDASVTHFPGAWSISSALVGAQQFEARVLEVDFCGPQAITDISMATTPHAHFGWFTVTPDNQPKMLELARKHAPESFVVPGLKAVNFHRSLDGKRVVNLGLWSGFDDLQALKTRPGFKPGAKYWLGVAGFRPHYFEVATVVAP